MDIFLKAERLELQLAEDRMRAANAMHSHTKAEAKRQTRMLLSSAKGISASFAAGLIRGATQDKPSASKQLTSIARKFALSAWM